jgi:hypothetical protein
VEVSDALDLALVLSCLLRSENQPTNGEAESRHNEERLIHQLPVLSVLVISVEVSSTLNVREGVSQGNARPGSVVSECRLVWL